MSPILTSILLGLSAAAANIVSAVQPSFRKIGPAVICATLLRLGAGFMLATALVEMVPESLRLEPQYGPMLLLAGYLLVHFFEHTLTPHFHYGEETHAHEFVHAHKRSVGPAGTDDSHFL